MCKVDWEFVELGVALGGNTIFPSPSDCRHNRKCTDQCGMVEVEVRLRRVVAKGKI